MDLRVLFDWGRWIVPQQVVKVGEVAKLSARALLVVL